MNSIANYPRCHAYVLGMGISNSEGMEDRHYAYLLGDAAFSVEDLDGICAKGLHSSQWGDLLPAMEKILSRKQSDDVKAVASPRLQAAIGSRGVKTSALKTVEDWWVVAETMWPLFIERTEEMTLHDLHLQVVSLSKCERKYARDNMHKIPSKYIAETRQKAGAL